MFRDELRWDLQAETNWWLSLGLHIDHKNPSVTIHLPGVILTVGRCAVPMDLSILYEAELDEDDPDSFEITNPPRVIWGVYSLRDFIFGPTI